MTKLRQAANDFMTALQQTPERVTDYFQDRHVKTSPGRINIATSLLCHILFY